MVFYFTLFLTTVLCGAVIGEEGGNFYHPSDWSATKPATDGGAQQQNQAQVGIYHSKNS